MQASGTLRRREVAPGLPWWVVVVSVVAGLTVMAAVVLLLYKVACLHCT